LRFILRYPCNVPPVPSTHWWGESNPLAPPLPSTPAPVIASSKSDTEAQSKLDLDTRIEMLLSGMSSQGSLERGFLSIVKTDPDELPEIMDDIIDDLNSNIPSPPEVNDYQSDLDEEKVSNGDNTSPPLSNTPSPFLSKDIYLKCHKIAAEQLKISEEKAKLEAKYFLNNSIRSGKFITIICNYYLF